MPQPGRSFQNLTPFIPRVGPVTYELFKFTNPTGQVLENDVFFGFAPPAPEDGEWGDYWIWDDGEEVHVYRKAAVWEETAVVPSGDPIDAYIPFTYTLRFRTSEGVASLCGFDEFEHEEPSDPPKKYRTKVADGTVVICEDQEESCAAPSCPASYNFSFSGTIPGFGSAIFTAAGSFSLVSVVGNNATYQALNLSASRTPPSEPTEPLGVRLSGDASGSFNLNNDQTIVIDKAADPEVPISIQLFYGGFQQVETGCVSTGAPPYPITVDVWDVTRTYNETTCATATDLGDSERTDRSDYTCQEGAGTTGTFDFTQDPTAAYGSGATSEITSKTQIITNGAGCIDVGATWSNYAGSVVQDLSDEDTEDDAIERLGIEEPYGAYETWSGTLGEPNATTEYQARSEFSFDYKTTELRIALTGLIPEGNYEIGIEYRDRDWGTSDPFATSATETIIMQADTAGNLTITDHPMQNTRGKETIALLTAITRV